MKVTHVLGELKPGWFRLKVFHVSILLALLASGCTSDAGPGEAEGFDKFGGFKTITFEATGRFHVAKKHGDWWLVTPEGNAFFSHAVQGVSSTGTRDKNGDAPYLENILARYGSVEAWLENALQRLHEAGQNTIGDFSETEHFAGRIPYVDGVFFSSRAPAIEGAPEGFRGAAVDFFDPAFEEGASEEAEKLRTCAEDPHCIGAFIGDEYPWATSFLQPIPLFDAYQFLKPGAPGKVALQAFLQERYDNDITAFNTTWQTSFSSFDEVQNITVVKPDPENKPGLHEGILGGSFDLLGLTEGDFASLDGDPFRSWRVASAAQNKDRFAFRGRVAKQFYEVADAALNEISPEMLNLCGRFLATTVTEEVVRAAADHCDVISINAFDLPESTITGAPSLGIPGIFGIWASWTQAFVPNPAETASEDFLFYDVKLIQELVDKPVLLASFTYRAEVEGLNDFPPQTIFEILPDQSERANRYEAYVREALTLPSVVGAHWFIYSDQPAIGRFDGENSNFGIVDIEDNPYMDLTNRMAEVTRETLDLKTAP
jgi:agarase